MSLEFMSQTVGVIFFEPAHNRNPQETALGFGRFSKLSYEQLSPLQKVVRTALMILTFAGAGALFGAATSIVIKKFFEPGKTSLSQNRELLQAVRDFAFLGLVAGGFSSPEAAKHLGLEEQPVRGN